MYRFRVARTLRTISESLLVCSTTSGVTMTGDHLPMADGRYRFGIHQTLRVITRISRATTNRCILPVTVDKRREYHVSSGRAEEVTVPLRDS